MKPLAANTLLQNRYLIVHLIGKGGMGDVYLAIDQRLGSAVALKRTFFSGDVMLAGAFEREARTLARLRHNVLPKVSDHFIEEDTQYLIMEHIAGDDLAKRLEISGKPFPLGWVLFWADQLLDALGYLHAQEPPILHRDIKPQNLKLTDENSVVLLDFGLSKNTLGETRTTAATTGSVVGYTPHFAPMEQIRGTGTDARSDIYSLSATLYQLLTNVVPPDVLARADALISGKTDLIKPLNEIVVEIPENISEIILKGMAVSQEQRFADARQMQKALRGALADVQDLTLTNSGFLNAKSQSEVQEIQNSQLKTNITNPLLADAPPRSLSHKDFEEIEKHYSRPAVQSIQPKSSSGKFSTIIGLGVLLILAASGLGWFLLRNSETAERKITPTPAATATAVPTFAPTAETVAETSADSNNPNENANNSAEVDLPDANIQDDNQSGDGKNQNAAVRNGKTNAAPVVKSTPRPTRPRPATKTTPKAAPSSNATPLPQILP